MPLETSRLPLDRKFYGIIHKTKNNEVVPHDQFVVFLAKDNAFMPTLNFYKAECQRIGANMAQLQAIDDLIMRVAEWRENNRAMCKVPDVNNTTGG